MATQDAARKPAGATAPADLAPYIPLRLAVLEKLKRAILDGALKSGELLSENRIAADFSVSRTPVREALRVLEREGFVTVLPGRKIIVSVPDRQDIADIYEIRLMIESEALRRIRPDDHGTLQRLERCVDDGEAALQRGDLGELQRLNTEFHMILTGALRNERLRRFADSLHDTAARLRLYSLGEPEWARESEAEHRQLVAFLKAGDTESAVRLLRGHLEKGAGIVRSLLTQGEAAS